jgi:sensor histidine kinase YesM
MRLDKRVHLSYRVNGTITYQRIAPLTLMPFIENAFKHGVNPDQDSNINIIIEIQETSLKLTVENNKVQVTLDPYMKSGKGIENTKSRLKLLYPGKHFVVLDEDEKHFRVQLTMQLQ